jgi:lysophospholipase L1-like esterase
MTQALSTASTFTALVGRVAGLEAQVAAYGHSRYNNKVALLGDSITANGIANDATHTRNANRGMTFWVPFLTRQKFVSPQSLNFGVSGQTSAQIAARVGSVVTARPGVCVVLAGTNDIGTLSQATTKANLTAIYQALSGAGILIAAFPILNRTLTGESNYSYPQAINDWIRDQAKTYPGFYFVDPALFGDPFSLTYSARSGYTFDGLHPTAIGARYIAKPLADFLNTLVPEVPQYLRSLCDYYNSSNARGALNANSMVGGTAGTIGSGVSGVCADSFRIQAFANGGAIGSLTVAASKSTSILGQIENQKILIGGTATGGFDTSITFDQDATIYPSMLSNISSGDVIELIADVELAGGTVGISGVSAYFAAQIGGVYKWVEDGYTIVSDDFTSDAMAGTFRTPPLAITGTPTDVLAGIKVYLKNSGTTRAGDLRINNFAVRKIVS